MQVGAAPSGAFSLQKYFSEPTELTLTQGESMNHAIRSISWQHFARMDGVEAASSRQLPRTKLCAKWKYPTFSVWFTVTISPICPLQMISLILR